VILQERLLGFESGGQSTSVVRSWLDAPPRLDETPHLSPALLPAVVRLREPSGHPGHRRAVAAWLRAWEPAPESRRLSESTSTLTMLRRDVVRPLALTPARPLLAAEQLREWLGVTFDQLSDMTGIGRSTFHSWRHSEGSPRPSTVRGLWRLFSLSHALQARLGPVVAAGWLRQGTPSPLDLLLDGRLDEVEALARRDVLHPVDSGSNVFAWARLEDAEPRAETSAVRPTRVVRRANKPIKKGRPKGRD
jgi:hypothetical protein